MTKLSSPFIIDRRNFLKVSGLAAGALVALSLPKSFSLTLDHGAQNAPQKEVSKSGRLYRGGDTGSIFTSQDQGQTWQMHSNLGPKYSIQNIFTGADGRLYLQAGFQGYTFNLVLSKNEQVWLSQPNTTR
jgi:photosystem II stability/assembly factor-like uncharacterized protein